MTEFKWIRTVGTCDVCGTSDECIVYTPRSRIIAFTLTLISAISPRHLGFVICQRCLSRSFRLLEKE